jgi:hypothetical protein
VKVSVSLSAFGPPSAVVAVVRILFTPAVSRTLAVTVFPVVHAPVPEWPAWFDSTTARESTAPSDS